MTTRYKPPVGDSENHLGPPRSFQRGKDNQVENFLKDLGKKEKDRKYEKQRIGLKIKNKVNNTFNSKTRDTIPSFNVFHTCRSSLDCPPPPEKKKIRREPKFQSIGTYSNLLSSFFKCDKSACKHDSRTVKKDLHPFPFNWGHTSNFGAIFEISKALF